MARRFRLVKNYNLPRDVDRWKKKTWNFRFSQGPFKKKSSHHEAGAAMEVIDDAGSSPLRLEKMIDGDPEKNRWVVSNISRFIDIC